LNISATCKLWSESISARGNVWISFLLFINWFFTSM
jgi:hypothetical protein